MFNKRGTNVNIIYFVHNEFKIWKIRRVWNKHLHRADTVSVTVENRWDVFSVQWLRVPMSNSKCSWMQLLLLSLPLVLHTVQISTQNPRCIFVFIIFFNVVKKYSAQINGFTYYLRCQRPSAVYVHVEKSIAVRTMTIILSAFFF